MKQRIYELISSKAIMKQKIYGVICSRGMKLFLISTAATISIITLILSIIISFVDPNPYKEKIEQLVFERTGQVLELQGPLHISCSPSLSIVAKEVRLKKKKESKGTILEAETLKIHPSLIHLLVGKKVFKLEVTELNIKPFLISHVKTKLNLKQDSIELSSIKVGLKKGREQGTVEIDKLHVNVEEEIPKYYLKHEGSDFQLPLLMSFLGTKARVSGLTNIQVELHATGKTLAQIKKSLSGNLEVELTKGKLHGIDLIGTLKEAKSLFGTIASKISSGVSGAFNSLLRRKHNEPHGITPFDNIKLKARLHNGIIHTEHFNVFHRHYHVKGDGKINLSRNTVDCQVEALYKEHGTLKSTDRAILNQKNTKIRPKTTMEAMAPLSIQIKGPIMDPQIKPDMDSYFKYLRQKN